MRLPNDIARCHDEQCIHRRRCERWLGRDDAGARAHLDTCQDGADVPYPLLIAKNEEERND